MIPGDAAMIRSLIKVTAWEKVSLPRRLLCAFGRVLILALLLTAIGYALYANQYSLEARVWHWRHGYATTLGGYEIPVPNHWLLNTLDSTAFTLLNTSPPPRPHDGKIHITAIIDVDVYQSRFRKRSNWIDAWLSLEQQRLSREKVESLEEKTLDLADGSVTCIGGKELSAVLRGKPGLPQMDIISLDCMSERGLNIRFTGEPSDVESFYTFVSQIRRKS
jgi:hypothetical protein